MRWERPGHRKAISCTGFVVPKCITSNDGASPRPTLLLSGNALYGTTENGGQYGRGVLFRVPLAPPTIVRGLATHTAELAVNAGFRVVVNGLQPMCYQWYFNDTNMLSSATNSQRNSPDCNSVKGAPTSTSPLQANHNGSIGSSLLLEAVAQRLKASEHDKSAAAGWWPGCP